MSYKFEHDGVTYELPDGCERTEFERKLKGISEYEYYRWKR